MVASDVDVPAQTDVHQITATQILSCTTFEHSGQALCPLSYAGVSSIRGENNTSSLAFPTRHRKRKPSRSSPFQMRVAHGWQTRPQRFIIAAVTHFCQQSSSNGGDMRRLNLTGLLLVALLLTLPLQAPYAQQSSVRAAASAAAPSAYFDAERAAADRITADEMKEILYYIASDKMLGRDTPSAGLDATAKYIADRLAKYKYKPMGDNGTYFQHIALSKTAVDRENTNAQFGDKTYKVGEDILPMGRASGDVEGQLVYAGQGWVVNSKNINPYAGLDG